MREQIVRAIRPATPVPTWEQARAQLDPASLNPEAAPDQALIPAAVLVPLVEYDHGIEVLLTQRTAHLNDHAGQVSFPGGRREAHDEDAVATALRETAEEIGLQRDFIEPAGFLDSQHTGTGFLVIPVVAFVRPEFVLELDSFEVAEVFEVPLAFFLDFNNRRQESRFWQGMQRQYYAYRYANRSVWGATAGMLSNLGVRLAQEPDGG